MRQYLVIIVGCATYVISIAVGAVLFFPAMVTALGVYWFTWDAPFWATFWEVFYIPFFMWTGFMEWLADRLE